MVHSSTIDPYEIEYYHKMADLWWDTLGPFWPLHELNKLRVRWIKEKLFEYKFTSDSKALPLKGLNVLDIGCGGGILAESIATMGATVHGIDVVEKNIRIAQTHASKNKLDLVYTYTTVEELAEKNLTYDIIFNMEVVEHVADLYTFMHSCSSLVRTGGAMFVASINRTFAAYISAIIGAEYILQWLPKGTHRYSMLRKPSEITYLLNQGNLQTKELIGVGVNPLTRKFSLRKNTSINYMLFAQKNV